MFRYNDGGRKVAGYKGTAGDCAVRAVAIATELPYKEIYTNLFRFAGKSPRNGYSTKTLREYMKSIGWVWVPTMEFGSGCRVHLKKEELPSGRIIARVTKHFVAVVDGEIQDTYDSSRNGTRCVYGYWKGSR